MPEPGAGEPVMRQMLAEAKMTVLHGRRLPQSRGVVKQGLRVTEAVMENGARFAGKVFADRSYEGDLTAQAGVSYTYGREAAAEYGESLAGVRAHTASHQFAVDIPARDEQGKSLPEISSEPRGEPGPADKRIQAYNFRVIATAVAANRIPWPKPAGYDPKRYELLARYLTAMTKYMERPLTLNEVSLLRAIPNGKADFNNRGAFSTDCIGKNYAYPEGSYAERAKIWKEHIDCQQGFYYFLASDPRAPASLQQEIREWGLAKDEFTGTGHWPNQLYIREARRMTGSFVATQKDLQTGRTKQDAIGMGSCNSDSHNLQRHVTPEGIVLNEGGVQVPVQPYRIPFRVLLPKAAEAENVLAPVCFPASHIANSSLRMEPQYMIVGRAAGVAAALAIQKNIAVQATPVEELRKILLEEGAVFGQGAEIQLKALAWIREPAQPAPWARPEGKQECAEGWIPEYID